MPERVIEPPPERMVRLQQWPDHTVSIFSELVSRESTRYQALSPVPRGTIYAATVGADQRVIDIYPTLRFVREFAPYDSNSVNSMPGSEFVIWSWCSDPDAEGNYNAEITYLGDAVANPAYARISRIRRETYEASPTIALGTAYTALIGIKVTAGGTGYTSPPTVAISGSLGATAEAVLTAAGAVSHVIVTAEGAGYDSASLPTISFSGGAGTGATATAIVQPKTAILTSQKKTELPDSDPMAAEYVQVLRTWEVLPGPYLPFTRWSELLGPIQGTRRAVVWASQIATFTATAKTTYEAREGSSYVAWEIVETNSNGTGAAGNPAYPIYIDDFYDNDKGAVQKTTQVVVATGSEVGTFTVVGGVVTDTRYEVIDGDSFHLSKIIETWAVPAVIRTDDFHDNERGEVQRTTRLIEATGSEVSSSTVSGGTVTHIDYVAFNEKVLKKITETWAVPRTLLGQDYDRTLDVLLPYSLKREVAGASLGVAHSDVTPKGDGTDETKTIDASAISAALSAYSLSFPGTANLQLPDALVSVSGFIESNSGSGLTEDLAGSAAWSGHGSWTLTPKTSSQASAAIIPDVSVLINSAWAYNKPVTHYLFFLQAPVTAAQVLTKLTTLAGASVIAWPKFTPTGFTIFCVGSRLSLQATAQATAHDGGSDSSSEFAYSSGTGSSQEVGLTIKTVHVPPTIHDAISFSGTTSSFVDITAQAVADAYAISADSGEIDGTVTAYISPTSISSSGNAIAIPTTGLRLLDADCEPYAYGWVKVRGTVVDFANV